VDLPRPVKDLLQHGACRLGTVLARQIAAHREAIEFQGVAEVAVRRAVALQCRCGDVHALTDHGRGEFVAPVDDVETGEAPSEAIETLLYRRALNTAQQQLEEGRPRLSTASSR
jgi:hypothetical protein